MPFAREKNRRVAIVVSTLASAALVAACAPGSSNTAATSTESSAGPVNTAAPTAPVSLKLYDGQGLKAIDDALIAAFHTKNPNITITPTYDPDNVTTQNQPRQLASQTPPDLIRVISVAAGVKNNQLTNLDSYATAFGWDKLPASQLSQFRADKGVVGSGSLYAKPSGFTMTGLYYNKKLAEQIGVTAAPKSLDELTALFTKAKSAGLIALATNGKEGGAVFPFQLMINSTMGPKKVADWVFDVPGATIDTPEAVAAATTLQNWNKEGYLPPEVNSVDGPGALGIFQQGKAVFFASGNWDATSLDKTMAGNVGFWSMPPVTAGGQIAAMSDASTAFGIPAKSTNKDAAAQFLNFLSSDEARQIAADNGFMPTGTADQKAPTIKDGSVLTDVTKEFTAVSAAGGQVPFVQNATSGIYNLAWLPETQLLLAGKSTPQQYVTNVQAKYTDQVGK